MARIAVALAVLMTACGDTTSSTGGEAIFRSPVSDGNTFACATCHAVDEPDADDLRRPGHPIGDAAARPHFKNGRIATLRGAVNSCLTEWMAAEPWAETDARWSALEGWLESLAPIEQAPAVESLIVAPPPAADTGNPQAGRTLFNQTCIVCHGTDGAGTERGPRLAGFAHEPDFVAERIRRSGNAESEVYPGLSGGRMPFWAADRLTDSEVLDLAAYVNESEAREPGPGGGGNGSGGTTRTCAATHAKVGQTTTLSERAHGVKGSARIVDDCTIVLEGFSYDGGGIDVRIYAAQAADYDNGYPISPNILGTPYSNGSLTVQLPVDKTLDDLDGVSVWCVAASFSFGDGLFQ